MGEVQTNSGQPVPEDRGHQAGEIRYPDGRIEHPAVRYEPTDIRLRWLMVVILGACCFAALHYYVVWRYYWFQESAQEAIKKSPYPLAPTLSAQLPAEPRLEQIDRMAGVGSSNVDRSLAAKEKVLHSYGPTAEKGFVHVPIKQAMKAIAGQLPVAEGPPGRAAADNGLLEAGESNSGRMFRGQMP